MGMEIRQVRGEDAAQRFEELNREAHKYDVTPDTGHKRSNRLLLCAALFLVVTVVFGYVSYLIPPAGFALGALLAFLALAAFASALVFFIVALVQRFTKERVS